MCYQLSCVLYGTLVRLNVSYSDVRIVIIKYVRNVLDVIFCKWKLVVLALVSRSSFCFEL